LIIFINAIILSSLLHIYAVKVFNLSVSVNTALVEKGEEIRLVVRFSKSALPFIPTAFEIKLDLSEHLECENSSCVVTLSRREQEKVFIIKSRFWGKASVGIASVNAVDILGIFSSFPVLRRLSENNYLKAIKSGTEHPVQFVAVKIFPSVPDLSQNSEFVRTLKDSSDYDDNEQSREIPFAMVGFPGYEHRDYVPGDSLKSINWKLSAKRDRLLVRKPEAYAGGDQILILDALKAERTRGIGFENKPDLSVKLHEQTAMESMLTVARVLSKQEILYRVYVCFEREWRIIEIRGEEEIQNLRYALTEYSYVEKGNRLPDLANDKASGVVVFTARPNDALYSELEPLRQKGIIPEIASSVEGNINNWHIQEVDGEIIFGRA